MDPLADVDALSFMVPLGHQKDALRLDARTSSLDILKILEPLENVHKADILLDLLIFVPYRTQTA